MLVQLRLITVNIYIPIILGMKGADFAEPASGTIAK
jgi:hypothetical protein